MAVQGIANSMPIMPNRLAPIRIERKLVNTLRPTLFPIRCGMRIIDSVPCTTAKTRNKLTYESVGLFSADKLIREVMIPMVVPRYGTKLSMPVTMPIMMA